MNQAKEQGKQAWNKRSVAVLTALFVLLILIFGSMGIGRFSISISNIFKCLFRGEGTPQMKQVLYSVRLPRILAAILVGSALSVAGASYQGMFKNPLVSPDILGASSGAGFGAALAILMYMNIAGIKGMSFIFALFAVFLTWFISTGFGKGEDTLFLLILGGIIISSLFQSLLSLEKYVADPNNQLQEIVFWLMGSLSKAGMDDVKAMAIPVVLCFVVLHFCASKLNILSLGEEEAKSLGVHTTRLKGVVIITSTLLTAFAVSTCGMIGWVGLVVPHFARMIVGPNFKVLIPMSMLIGASYLLLIDDFCRTAFPVEVPLGIVTSLAGLPFFLYLLTRKNKGW